MFPRRPARGVLVEWRMVGDLAWGPPGPLKRPAVGLDGIAAEAGNAREVEPMGEKKQGGA